MDIKTLEIKSMSGDVLRGNFENILHIKSLPYLSVVQSVHGSYEIGLSGAFPVFTETGGAFVAPADANQYIVHHNGPNGYMEAQWAFLQIIVNDLFTLEDVFDLPLLLPAKYRAILSELLLVIRSDTSLCRKYAAAYQLTDLLIAHSTVKNTVFDPSAALLKKYIDEHYHESLSATDLANVAICSVPNLYRLFRKHFHLSPHNYINKVRLEKASVLLENSIQSVTEISEAVGFEDPVYFSRLFKNSYQLSPQKYRAVVRPMKYDRNTDA